MMFGIMWRMCDPQLLRRLMMPCCANWWQAASDSQLQKPLSVWATYIISTPFTKRTALKDDKGHFKFSLIYQILSLCQLMHMGSGAWKTFSLGNWIILSIAVLGLQKGWDLRNLCFELILKMKICFSQVVVSLALQVGEGSPRSSSSGSRFSSQKSFFLGHMAACYFFYFYFLFLLQQVHLFSSGLPAIPPSSHRPLPWEVGQ